MENQQRAVKTTAQALAQQKADAERERQQKAPPKAALDRFATGQDGQQRQEVVPAAKQSVALPDGDGRTVPQKYIDQIAPSSIAGRMMKFSKNGEFVVADTEEVVSPDTDFIALCDETLIGWIKFHRDDEERPPDRIMGILYDGFAMPPREALGDLNRAEWPLGLSGTPEDPWQHQICLVLQAPGTHELFTFVTTSRTGRRAIGNLLRHYDRLRKKDDEHYPVVRCKAGGFNHRDDRIGWVPVPTFAIVGKAPKVSAAIPDTSPSGDLNDQIPF